MGKCQEANHVFSGLANHDHLSDDIQLLSLGHAGREQKWTRFVPALTDLLKLIGSFFAFQVCKFQVGSYSYNMEKMIFEVTHLGYSHTSR